MNRFRETDAPVIHDHGDVQGSVGLAFLGGVVGDLRYVGRSLKRSSGFAAAVVLTLAFAIGANTAIFSVVRGVILRPLPHRDGSRVMVLRQSTQTAPNDNIEFSVPEITDLRESAKTLAGVAEYVILVSIGIVAVLGSSVAERTTSSAFE